MDRASMWEARDAPPPPPLPHGRPNSFNFMQFLRNLAKLCVATPLESEAPTLGKSIIICPPLVFGEILDPPLLLDGPV